MALLPIGDRFTMGPREAAHAIGFWALKHVVPMHYATFPVDRRRSNKNKKRKTLPDGDSRVKPERSMIEVTILRSAFTQEDGG